MIKAPETGEQVEIGWRGSFYDDNLSATLAVYELTKNDVIVPTGIPNISEVAGEQRSRGVELDINGSIGTVWDIFFSYAYTDTEIIDAGTTSTTDGDPFLGVPEHKSVLWNSFSAAFLGLDNVTFGYVIDYASDYETSALTDVATLSFGPVGVDKQGFVHNINVAYSTDSSWGDLEVTVALRNLTDEWYVLNTSNAIFGKRGEPRSYLLTTTLNF